MEGLLCLFAEPMGAKEYKKYRKWYIQLGRKYSAKIAVNRKTGRNCQVNEQMT